MSINRCALSGNCTRDSELKTTTGGTPVLTFGLAFNRRKRDASTGDWVDVPNFIDCVVYGKRAEALHARLLKGTKVFVAGELCYSQWERDGHTRSKIELIVIDLDFASGGKQGNNQQQAQQQAAQAAYSAPAPAYSAPEPAYAAPELYDEEIPF